MCYYLFKHIFNYLLSCIITIFFNYFITDSLDKYMIGIMYVILVTSSLFIRSMDIMVYHHFRCMVLCCYLNMKRKKKWDGWTHKLET